jgi:hypothetical protein
MDPICGIVLMSAARRRRKKINIFKTDMGMRASKEGMERCRNVYIHHGSNSHLRGLVQVRTKENNLCNLKFDSFLLHIYFQLFSYILMMIMNIIIKYFNRCTRLSRTTYASSNSSHT